MVTHKLQVEHGTR